MFMIYERTNPRAFDRDKRRDCLQALRNAANAWSSVDVKKPILPAGLVCAPERAPRRRDVNAHADAVTEHGYVRQPGNQFRARDLTSSVGQIIGMEGGLRFSNPLQEVRADKWSRFHLVEATLYSLGTGATPARYSSSQSIDSSNLRNWGLSAESAGSHSATGSRFHHALSPIGANR